MIKLDPNIIKQLENIEIRLNQVEKCKDFGQGLKIFDELMQEFTILVAVINEAYTKLTQLHKSFNKQLSN